MARLYTGFNALGIGQSINDLHNNIYAQRSRNIDRMGSALSQLFQAQAEANEQERQKQSAMDFLTGNGMSQENAQALANSGIAPGDLTKYMQGRIDAASDKADDRSYEEKIHGRDRSELLSDRDAQWAHELKRFAMETGIKYEQAVKLAQYGALMNNLATITATNWGNSRAGKDKYDAGVKAVEDFTTLNPEFANVLGTLNNPYAENDGSGFYDEDIVETLIKLGGKEHTDAEKEEYLKKLERANKLTYVLSNPEIFRDPINIFTANADNKRLSPYLNLERVIGGTTTAPQRKREQDDAAFARKVSSIKNALEKESGKPWGEGKLPEGIDEKVKKELKKDKAAWSRYLKLGGS